MPDRPTIITPTPGTTLDYSKGKITFRWTESEGPHVKNWWLSIGTKDGLWDIRNLDKGKGEEETILVEELPTSGKVYAQIYGKVDGKDDKGKPMGEDEEIQSDPIWWNSHGSSVQLS
jgi:hypothetical protein